MVQAAAARPFSQDSFVAGEICLDFVNTVGGARGKKNDDMLASFGDLISWSLSAGLIDEARARSFEAGGRAWPALAVKSLQGTIGFREALHAIFKAAGASEPPKEADLDILNGVLADAAAHERLTYADGAFAMRWDFEAAGLDALLWPVAASAAELLLSPRRLFVRECASTTCGWLFLDASKNKTRRWCDMRVCGNRAKARRHRSSAP
jgi:predicted RNA-binding Zn ribbon-like protein